MDELVRWLEVQLNWDAAVARCACHLDEGQWRQDDPQRYQGRIVDDRGEMVVKDEGMLSEQRARHIAEHDPARVLREIDAKRQLVELHHPELIEVTNADRDERSGYWCFECDSEPFPCRTLRLLALPYAGRPGYREAWRP
jgi:hypothetical protein